MMTILLQKDKFALLDEYIPQAPPYSGKKDEEWLNTEANYPVNGEKLTYEGAVEMLEAFKPWMGEFANDIRMIYDCGTTFDEIVARWPEAREAFLHENKMYMDSASRYRPWDVPDGDAIAWYDTMVEKERNPLPNRSKVFSTMLDVYFDNRYWRPQYSGVLFTFMANDYRTRLGKKVHPITWHRFNREKALAAEGKSWKAFMAVMFNDSGGFPIPQGAVPVEAGPDKGKFRTPIKHWKNDGYKAIRSLDELLGVVRGWWQKEARYPREFADEDDRGAWMDMATRAFDEQVAEGEPLHDMLRDYFEVADGRVQDDATYPHHLVNARALPIVDAFQEAFQETVAAFYEWHARRGRERPALLLRGVLGEELRVDFYDIHDAVEIRYPPDATFFG